MLRPASRRSAVLLILLTAILLLTACGGSSPTSAGSMANASSGVARQAPADGPGRAVPNEGAVHVQEGSPITYQHYPPASGTHYPRWARYGVYQNTIPEGYWVHNLEHGAIVVLYKCTDDCAAKAAEIEQLYRQLPNGKYGEVKLVALPYDNMQTTYAVVAWDRIDEFDEWDPERVTRFYQAYVDKGPEDVP